MPFRAACLHAGVAVLIVLKWALPAHAQTQPPFIPEVVEIRRLLESATPRDQAWGAWLAAQAQARELVPLLRQVASAHRTATVGPDSLTTGAALDALIQLGTTPRGTSHSAAWARTFFDRWPAESLILVSRSGEDASAELLNLASSQTGIRWLTAANLLLARRPPGFAAILLRGLEIPASLAIVSGEIELVGLVTASASAEDGVSFRVPGFPPLTRYYLSSGPHPGAVVLATGPRTIFYIRNVSPPGETAQWNWTDTDAPTSRDRLDFIAALLKTQSHQIINSYESRSVVWREGLSVEKESAAFRADILARYRSLITRLVGERLLTQAEANALPPLKIVITIHDKRGS